MRGVVSAGMLKAFEHLQLLTAFDVVYGSSAGALNGAFFLASQSAYGLSIYFEEINNSSFISLGRSVTRNPVMSLDYLLGDVMIRRKILDWRAVLDSPIELKVVATSLEDLRVRLLTDFRDREHLFAALRASSSVPLIAGPPSVVDGERFLDALLLEPIAYRSAIRDGCTHVLVLLTRPEGKLNGKPTLFERHVLGRWIASLEPRLRDAYLAQEHAYDRKVSRLKARTVTPESAPWFYALFLPATSPPIRWLERDRALLEAAAVASYELVIETFG